MINTQKNDRVLDSSEYRELMTGKPVARYILAWQTLRSPQKERHKNPPSKTQLKLATAQFIKYDQKLNIGKVYLRRARKRDELVGASFTKL